MKRDRIGTVLVNDSYIQIKDSVIITLQVEPRIYVLACHDTLDIESVGYDMTNQ